MTEEALFAVPRIGVEQDFFLDLGGHSLIAAQMAAMLRSRADLHLAVRDVYSYPTVRKLAAYLAQQPETTTAAKSAHESAAITGLVPGVLFSQTRCSVPPIRA